jgi:hypothetical protein
MVARPASAYWANVSYSRARTSGVRRARKSLVMSAMTSFSPVQQGD